MTHVFFPLSRNVVHMHDMRVVLLGFEVILTKICRHCLIRLQLKRRCCCCFVSQKLHFYIKTQKNYCNKHKWTVFFTITRKDIVIHEFLCFHFISFMVTSRRIIVYEQRNWWITIFFLVMVKNTVLLWYLQQCFCVFFFFFFFFLFDSHGVTAYGYVSVFWC